MSKKSSSSSDGSVQGRKCVVHYTVTLSPGKFAYDTPQVILKPGHGLKLNAHGEGMRYYEKYHGIIVPSIRQKPEPPQLEPDPSLRDFHGIAKRVSLKNPGCHYVELVKLKYRNLSCDANGTPLGLNFGLCTIPYEDKCGGTAICEVLDLPIAPSDASGGFVELEASLQQSPAALAEVTQRFGKWTRDETLIHEEVGDYIIFAKSKSDDDSDEGKNPLFQLLEIIKANDIKEKGSSDIDAKIVPKIGALFKSKGLTEETAIAVERDLYFHLVERYEKALRHTTTASSVEDDLVISIVPSAAGSRGDFFHSSKFHQGDQLSLIGELTITYTDVSDS